MIKLKKYIAERGIRTKFFAGKIGMNYGQLHVSLAKGLCLPEMYWEAIEKETRGEVTKQDCFEWNVSVQIAREESKNQLSEK